MTVAVVHVVDVIIVGHRHVPTALAMHVSMLCVLTVPADLALIRVTVVLTVQMPVVHVVDVIAVRHCHVAAALAVRMAVPGMRLMLQGCRHCTHLLEFGPLPIRGVLQCSSRLHPDNKGHHGEHTSTNRIMTRRAIENDFRCDIEKCTASISVCTVARAPTPERRSPQPST